MQPRCTAAAHAFREMALACCTVRSLFPLCLEMREARPGELTVNSSIAETVSTESLSTASAGVPLKTVYRPSSPFHGERSRGAREEWS